MTQNRAALIKAAQSKAKQLQKLREDPRYVRTLGKLRHAGLLDVRDIPKYRGQVFLDDALWAAELEPRIYELLPAIIMRRPKLFVFFQLPDDLRLAVKEMKAGKPATPYHGISAEKYNRWVKFVGHKSSPPKITRTFRFSCDDLETLERIAKEKGKSSTQILREALRQYVEAIK